MVLRQRELEARLKKTELSYGDLRKEFLNKKGYRDGLFSRYPCDIPPNKLEWGAPAYLIGVKF